MPQDVLYTQGLIFDFAVRMEQVSEFPCLPNRVNLIHFLAEERPDRILVLGTKLGEATSFWDQNLVPAGVVGAALPAAETACSLVRRCRQCLSRRLEIDLLMSRKSDDYAGKDIALTHTRWPPEGCRSWDSSRENRNVDRNVRRLECCS
ncbi:MAG: hypothetical protein GY719_21855 [bacterium]|nr:hypothetical protein [bacterium]